MSAQENPLPTYSTGKINWDAFVRRYAAENGIKYRNAMRWICERDTLEQAAQLMGAPLSLGQDVDATIKKRNRAWLRELGDYLSARGYTPPKEGPSSVEWYTKSRAHPKTPLVIEARVKRNERLLGWMQHEWTPQQMARLSDMWRDGMSVEAIAEAFGCDPDEVAVIVIDRAHVGAIDAREGVEDDRKRT